MNPQPLIQTTSALDQLANCQIMAILNITPDSVSDDGVMHDTALIRARIERHIAHGADLIDIGAESSRPNAKPVSLEEELNRLKPVFNLLKDYSIPFSIDTYKPEVMAAAIAHGVCYINDIKALQMPGALEVVAQSDTKVILMHMLGTPETMQQQPHYANIIDDLQHFFKQRIAACLKAGIASERIIIDPGFGFGKTMTHNYTLLNQLAQLRTLGYPILSGISRKSMLNACIDLPAQARDYLSAGADIAALMHGASIIRTHQPQILSHMRTVWQKTRGH